MAHEVRQHGGAASVLNLMPRDEAQKAELPAQLQRTVAHVRWRDGAVTLATALDNLGETETRLTLRSVEKYFRSVCRIHCYPGATAHQAQLETTALRSALEKWCSEGEPQSRRRCDIERLDPAYFQGQRWAIRARPWVDRLARTCLIQRFVDRQAEFARLLDTATGLQKPDAEVGFDYDGTGFTHAGDPVTFETLMASFALDHDPRLRRIAATVHYLEVGGILVAEAAGPEAILGGLRALQRSDDELLSTASTIFDALYATPASHPGIHP
jgi:hypothetical protein